MKPSVKRALGFLGIVIFLVAALVVYASFIRPDLEKITELRGSLATKSRFFDEQQQIIKNISEYLTGKETEIKKSQAAVSSALPTDINVADLYNQLSILIRVNGLTMQEFGLDILAIKPTPAGSLLKGRGTVQIEIKLNGSYLSLKSFISQLERNIRLMDVAKLTAKSTTNRDVLDYDIVVDTYYQAE